ncbi:MAG: N-acetylmuramoyl-L-alanine amidase [Prevotella sp.]|nr:N-acetylmuramoyl-L-alanine amidase [Prevotella sp.]
MNRVVLLKQFLAWMLLAFFMLTPAHAVNGQKYTLVIDAGHGGRDGGACANGAREKDINLSVALAFGRLVEQNCQDVRVIYTRKTDVFVPLHERADIANRNHADVFISIHTNSVARGRSVAGMETYTMGMRRSDEKLSAAMRENEVILIEGDYQQHYAGFDPRVPESYIIFDIVNETNMAESVRLAQLIQQHTCATARRTNKGVKQDAFLVLRETSMPACLIELGYITTSSEATFLSSRDGVNSLARGIYQAFVAYRGQQAAPVTQPAAPVTQPAAPRGGANGTATDSTAADTSRQGGAAVSGGAATANTSAPVFKVQILASTTQVPAGDRQFKGLTGVESYKEGSLWKYTVGSSTDYNEIVRLRRSILDKFPQAFIIAFKNGLKVDTQAAIQEFRVTN